MRGAQRPAGEDPWCPPRPCQRGLRPVKEGRQTNIRLINCSSSDDNNNSTIISYNEGEGGGVKKKKILGVLRGIATQNSAL